MKTAIVVPPGIRPYYPIYSIELLYNVIRDCGIDSFILDLNLLFFQTFYKPQLYISETIVLSDPYLKTACDLFCNPKGLTKRSYDRACSHMMLRDAQFNHFSPNVKVKMFDMYWEKDLKYYMDNIQKNACNLFIEQILYYCIQNHENSLKETDFIFASIMAREQLYSICLMSQIIKNKVKKDIRIIIGGPYVESHRNTAFFSEIVKYIDGISLGDIEEVIPLLFHNNQFYKECSVLYTANSNKLPETLKVKNHKLYKKPLDFSCFRSLHYFYPHFKTPLITSYECCYGKCLFCTDKGKKDYFCRIYRVDHVIDSMKACIKQGSFHFELIDDNIHAKYLKLMAKQIISNQLTLNWISNTRFYSEFLNFEFCSLLKESGCKKLFMGLESYNQDSLDLMNKGIQKKNILPILQNLHHAGIITHISILFGFPGDTKTAAEETFQFITDNNVYIDILEVNRFVNVTNIFEKPVGYDVDYYYNKLKAFSNAANMEPTYFNIYNLYTKEKHNEL